MWSAATILARAKEFVRTYADEDRVTASDVRSAFEQFATESHAFKITTTYTTVANQREYPLGAILYVQRVLYDGEELPRAAPVPRYERRSYHVDANQIVLHFEPPAGVTLITEGYGVPSNIDTVDLQPENYWMDVVAYLTAALVLSRYGDAQAVGRAQSYYAYYQRAINELRRMQMQGTIERGAQSITIRRIQL